MSGMFRFKQFSVDQTGCAMKINTDGVLLGAIANVEEPRTILDIGTGTGVIAMMLAQRFSDANIDAVEIDEAASKTASLNFTNSPFANRLKLYPIGFQEYFKDESVKKYDLIVSNPPFYLNSLQSPGVKKNLAKHTDVSFFEELVSAVSLHLTTKGKLWLILPPEVASVVKELAIADGLHLHKTINIHSFNDDLPHREILAFGFEQVEKVIDRLVIYNEPKVYTEEYSELLENFLTIF